MIHMHMNRKHTSRKRKWQNYLSPVQFKTQSPSPVFPECQDKNVKNQTSSIICGKVCMKGNCNEMCKKITVQECVLYACLK